MEIASTLDLEDDTELSQHGLLAQTTDDDVRPPVSQRVLRALKRGPRGPLFWSLALGFVAAALACVGLLQGANTVAPRSSAKQLKLYANAMTAHTNTTNKSTSSAPDFWPYAPLPPLPRMPGQRHKKAHAEKLKPHAEHANANAAGRDQSAKNGSALAKERHENRSAEHALASPKKGPAEKLKPHTEHAKANAAGSDQAAKDVPALVKERHENRSAEHALALPKKAPAEKVKPHAEHANANAAGSDQSAKDVPALVKERHENRSAEHALALQKQADAEKERMIVETLGAIPDFRWGAATSAYQVEGAWNEGGRAESIWDVFCHSGRALSGVTGDVACDHYHNWQSDLGLVAQYGFNTYRFSISWTRVFPFVNGKPTPNQEGIDFYKNILAELQSRGITPMVTMFHWDLPKQLDWRSPDVVDHFHDYAKFLLDTFPEVKLWISVNEPFTFCLLGYHIGIHAPGVRSPYDHYKCGHHVLLAHAKTFDMFQKRFSSESGYKMGAVLNFDFPQPLDPTNPEDVQSVQANAVEQIGWFGDPLFFGDYPKELRLIAGDNLPNFTAAEKSLLLSGANHPMSFYGLNTYSGKYVSAPDHDPLHPFVQFWKDGKPIGERFISSWLYGVPQEILHHLRWVNNRYRPRQIYITENGCSDPGRTQLEYTVNDWYRIAFFRDYLANVAQAVKEGIPVQGYIVWSLMDNFEWADGYARRFGITYVDFQTQKRTPKLSAFWWLHLNERMGVPSPTAISGVDAAHVYK